MKFIGVLALAVLMVSCGGFNKVLKNKDPHYKLRMAEQYYAKKKYNYAQQLYEDIMPYFRGGPEFEDIYYKYAYTGYYQGDYLNAENLFKTFLEIYPNSSRAEEIDYMRAYTFYKQSPKPSLDQTNTIKAMGMMQTFINTHPGSARNKEAAEIINICRQKLEIKDHNAAQLYYDLGQFRAAAVAFNTLLNSYPESNKSDEYKMMAIKSYFRFAELSIEDKRAERFEKVIEECNEFIDRFPQSPLSPQVQEYLTQSQNNLKLYTNEPAKTST
ncbi:outer membrane protein assembly factor BamD [Flavisolibacter ginsengisoli]|jgi:outer membrane protein assembly factor BamD|uniref:Beta-barrel assembly machine subunit BamD n=1 Tax=Flavisolibacter ginsengisoli DSM 18119 TaxID=1121884 RepID=A0A1M5FBI6_9BACT|nr:outer membrane protein assembly factor BamD [Flavisolibacter ginsengisoli]SHF88904.1 Beta-barrel assembly machine subunit BamD [Flavisolibacter ginsengisoli DSM 18119]